MKLNARCNILAVDAKTRTGSKGKKGNGCEQIGGNVKRESDTRTNISMGRETGERCGNKRIGGTQDGATRVRTNGWI